MLLDSVIPRSLLHFPLSPLPLFKRRISPSCHSLGIFFLYILLQFFRYICLVLMLVSIRASLGIVSGLQLFPLFRVLIVAFSSSMPMGFTSSLVFSSLLPQCG